MTLIQLSGLALKTHDCPYLFDINPYAHQCELRRLIQEEERFVAVNDSPTGGGKTLSWLAPAFEQQLDTVAVYPTNALVEDQYKSIQKKVQEKTDHDVAVVVATSDRLSQLQEEYPANSHGIVLDEHLRAIGRTNDQRILLTNPDILVMLRRDMYRKATREYKNFELAVADEFHRAGRKEQNTLRYLFDEMQSEDDEIIGLRQVVFLSATPDTRQEQLFDEAMAAPYYRVTEGNQHEVQPFTEQLADGWYAAMPPVELDVRTAPTFGTADILLNEDRDETLSFCRDARTVIILDGIHEVDQVHSWLDEELQGQVERIDGFHSENKPEKLEQFDILVSNSAVEVGIDFDVDQILFAGHNRDSFLQRLGRLRSKTTWHKARCYVPQAVATTLSNHDNEQLTRVELDTILYEIYPEPRQPETFDARYSAAEAFEHLSNRLKNAPHDEHELIRDSTLDRIKRHFGVGMNTDFSLRDMEAFTEALNWRILRTLQWYRGDSVQALVYDVFNDRITTYNLFYLLRYGDVEFFDWIEFDNIVPEKHTKEIARRRHYVDGFCIYCGTIETTNEGYGRDVYFSGGMLYNWISGTTNTSRKPKVVSGLKIGVDPGETGNRVPSVTKVNERLRSCDEQANTNTDAGLLCYPVSGVPSQVKRQYNLGDFFFLYSVRVQSEDLHSLAIGTDALYLHCHVLEQNNQLTGGGDEYIGGI